MTPNDAIQYEPCTERLDRTILRNLAIALAGGVAQAWSSGALARWPRATVLMLWPSFGGHFVELLFLNRLRPRLPADRAVLAIARLATWLAGGTILFLGMRLTAKAMGSGRTAHWLDYWWLGGPAFVAIELAVHAFLQLRGRPSFYNGRG